VKGRRDERAVTWTLSFKRTDAKPFVTRDWKIDVATKAALSAFRDVQGGQALNFRHRSAIRSLSGRRRGTRPRGVRPKLARLSRVKAQYDPRNAMHVTST
jgi:hypothetical protein